MPNNEIRQFIFESNLLTWILIIAMFFMVEIGWRVGRRFANTYGLKKADANDTFMAAIFGLLALLLAITFSGASDRFDKRRDLIAKELSTIGTAYQSIDLLAPASQPAIREMFKKYLDSRINIYQGKLTENGVAKKYQEHNEIGSQLWAKLVKAVQATPYPEKLVAASILQEVSDMFDASENQRLGMKFHPPPIIWQALICLSLIGALIAGYNLGLEQKRDWFLTFLFVLLMTGTIAIILNLEYPRIGFVNLDDFDLELVALRNSL